MDRVSRISEQLAILQRAAGACSDAAVRPDKLVEARITTDDGGVLKAGAGAYIANAARESYGV